MNDRADFMERHYTIPELAKAWGMSPDKLRGWFNGVPGIIRFGTPKLTKGRKRTYVSLRVPESVARKVYKERTGSSAQLASGN